MSKRKVREVLYEVWEECPSCSGDLKVIDFVDESNYYAGVPLNNAVCQSCGNEELIFEMSPRIVKEYEEIE